MKIKVAIVENDNLYLRRLTNSLNNKYFETITVYTYENVEVFEEAATKIRANVVLVSETFDFTCPKGANFSFAYLAADKNSPSVLGTRVIEKYQKVEKIYKQIIDLFSEVAGATAFAGSDNGSNCKIIGFFSVGGGSGATAVSIAYARKVASENKSVLYLSFDKNNISDLVLSDEGSHTMSDIIKAVKSKTTNVKLKLNSCLQQDHTGVYFYSPCKNILDFSEFTGEEKITLLKTLASSNNENDIMLKEFDVIVVDFEFELSQNCAELIKLMYRVLAVLSADDVYEKKFDNLYKILPHFEDRHGVDLINRLGVICNKNPRNAKVINTEANIIGSIPKLPDNISYAEIVNGLQGMPVMNQIDV